MQLSSSTSSWLRQADSQFLHLALFARDAAGLAVEPSMHIPPPLAWDSAGHREIIDADQRAAAAIQWAEWWDQLLAYVADDAKRSGDERDYEVMERLRLLAERQTRAFDPPDFRSLTSTPELQSVVIATFQEGLDRYDRSRLNMRLPAAAKSFGSDVARNAAESVAAERDIPLGDLRAVVHVLDVEGPWSCLAGPGCALCSVSVTVDTNALSLLLHDVFVSASSQES